MYVIAVPTHSLLCIIIDVMSSLTQYTVWSTHYTLRGAEERSCNWWMHNAFDIWSLGVLTVAWYLVTSDTTLTAGRGECESNVSLDEEDLVDCSLCGATLFTLK